MVNAWLGFRCFTHEVQNKQKNLNQTETSLPNISLCISVVHPVSSCWGENWWEHSAFSYHFIHWKCNSFVAILLYNGHYMNKGGKILSMIKIKTLATRASSHFQMSTSLRIRTLKSHFQKNFSILLIEIEGKGLQKWKEPTIFLLGTKFHQNWLNNKEIMPIILQFHFAAGPSPRRKIAYFIRKKIPRKVLNFTTLNYHNFFSRRDIRKR